MQKTDISPELVKIMKMLQSSVLQKEDIYSLEGYEQNDRDAIVEEDDTDENSIDKIFSFPMDRH